jgi:hypothetical protein
MVTIPTSLPALHGPSAAELATYRTAILELQASPTWTVATLANGWSGTFKYRQVPSPPGAWQFFIRIIPGTKADGTTVTTLPVGSRPLHDQDIDVSVTSMAGATAQSPHLNISASGVISCWGCANTGSANAAALLPFDA